MTAGSSAVAPISGSLDVVAVDADPVHLAAAPHLALADHRDVVLGHAGDDAGVAAGARVEVDGHPPLVTLAVVLPGSTAAARAAAGESSSAKSGFCLYSASVASWAMGRPSVELCSCVWAKKYGSSPVLVTVAPAAKPSVSRRAERVDVEALAVADAPGLLCAPSRASARPSGRPGRGRSTRPR